MYMSMSTIQIMNGGGRTGLAVVGKRLRILVLSDFIAACGGIGGSLEQPFP